MRLSLVLAVAAIVTTGLMADKCILDMGPGGIMGTPKEAQAECNLDNGTDCNASKGCVWSDKDNKCEKK